jgi:hypothetical protein
MCPMANFGINGVETLGSITELIKIMMTPVFYNMMPCGLVQKCQCLRGTYLLHIKGRRVFLAYFPYSKKQKGGL